MCEFLNENCETDLDIRIYASYQLRTIPPVTEEKSREEHYEEEV